MIIIDSIKSIFQKSENNGKQVEMNLPRDMTAQIRGQIRYVNYSKKPRITYVDGVSKRIFAMDYNPQDTDKVIVRHRRSKKTKDVVSIPASAVIGLANPNRFVCLSHTSKGDRVMGKSNPYYLMINKVLEQDETIERKNQQIERLENEIKKLNKSIGEIKNDFIEDVKKVNEGVASVMKSGGRPRKGDRRDDYGY